MDSVVANLNTSLKEANNYTDEDIAFALYKDQLVGWGYVNSPQVHNLTQGLLASQDTQEMSVPDTVSVMALS